MAATYEVHTFTKAPDGALQPGRVIVAPSEAEAVQTAEALVPSVAGALALQIVRDDQGKAWTVTGCGAMGDVPDDYAARLFEALTGER